MTRLTIAEAPGDEFAIRGQNTVTGANEDGIIFYDDVSKVHVLPDHHTFTIQVITPDLEVEMDFPDADSVREALEQFEKKRVLEVTPEVHGSVRMMPSQPEPIESKPLESGLKDISNGPDKAATFGEAFIKPESDSILEQVPSRPDERPSENLPDTQKQ
jgi:hypothetical protein